MICSDCIRYVVCENITDPSMKNIVNGCEVEKLCSAYKNESEIEAEAIKEFAERLKERCIDEITDNINNPCVRILYDAEETIDELVKEMTEENND